MTDPHGGMDDCRTETGTVALSMAEKVHETVNGPFLLDAQVLWAMVSYSFNQTLKTLLTPSTGDTGRSRGGLFGARGG